MASNKYHLGGWVKSIILTSFFCIVIAFTTQEIWGSSLQDHLVISFGFGYSAVFSAHLLSRYQPQLSLRSINFFALTVSMVFGTFNAYFWLNQYSEYGEVTRLKPIIILGFIFTTACFFYFHSQEQKITAQKELEVAKRKQSEQEKALILSQLKQLQSQIEPHFLFNTLANISSLIDQDPANARLMLVRLTDLLRGTLKNSREPYISLKKELAHADAYLAIQKIRLGERLQYEILNEIPSDIDLPPFILQPLVENAIGHGVEPLENGGAVQIRVYQLREDILIEVTDNGPGLVGSSNHSGHGVGLDNIRQRLQALFGDKAALSIVELQSGGVNSRLTIALSALQSMEEIADEIN